MFTSSMAYASEKNRENDYRSIPREMTAGMVENLPIISPTKRQIMENEILEDLETYKKLEHALALRERAKYVIEAASVVGFISSILVIVPEPTTTLVGGVIGASAVGIGLGAHLMIKYIEKKQIKEYCDSLSFHPSLETIELERKLMLDMKREDKLKIRKGNLVKKQKDHQNQLNEAHGLKKLGKRLQRAYDKVRLERNKKELAQLHSHYQATRNKLESILKDKVKNLKQEEVLIIQLKSDLLQQNDYNMTGYYEYYRKIRQDEYNLIIDELNR